MIHDACRQLETTCIVCGSVISPDGNGCVSRACETCLAEIDELGRFFLRARLSQDKTR